MRKIFLLLLLTLASGSAWAAPETPTAKPVKAVHLSVLRLFTDKKDCTYTHPYPPDGPKCAVLLKNNKRWADLKMKGTDKGGVYIGVDPKNLAPYLDKGALQFYIRGNRGGETLSAVGFTMANDGKHKFNFNTFVPLGDYCGVTTKWQVVTIPLSEFPLSGKHVEVDAEARRLQMATNQQISNSGDQLYQCRFNWEKVTEVQFEHSPNDEGDMEIEISNVVILPQYKLKTVLREKEAIQ
jgi:hypothetical protein